MCVVHSVPLMRVLARCFLAFRGIGAGAVDTAVVAAPHQRNTPKRSIHPKAEGPGMADHNAEAPAQLSLAALIRTFGRIGLLSFGGPAAQIALMHRTLVDERKWLSDAAFLRALSFCMLLPGPEAMQLATYCGWRMRGVLGGLIAGGLFVGPGAVVIFLLAWLYAQFGQVGLVQAAFVGIKATVIVVVVQALATVSRRALKGPDNWLIAALAFAAIFAFNLPFPLIVGVAAAYGFVRASPNARAPNATRKEQHGNPARTIAVWLALWLGPVAVAMVISQAFLGQVALFFSKLAVVTFGGAYAVLTYMTQQVVTDFGWLTTAQMIDALGLAETTPGPLILVTQFVGFLAGWQQAGAAMAFATAALTLWVTFTPCFLWIFAAAPYIDRLADLPRLSGALAAVTAAVVGVIANLSVWFAVHVFFGQVGQITAGPVVLIWPTAASANIWAIGLAVFSASLLIWLRLPLPWALLVAALAALGLSLAGASVI